MIDTKRVMNLLGLALRAGKLVCGDQAASKYLRKKSVPLLFLASDGSAAVQETYRHVAQKKGIRLVDILTKEELGQALGHSQHVIVLLTDQGFATAIDKVTNEHSSKGVTR